MEWVYFRISGYVVLPALKILRYCTLYVREAKQGSSQCPVSEIQGLMAVITYLLYRGMLPEPVYMSLTEACQFLQDSILHTFCEQLFFHSPNSFCGFPIIPRMHCMQSNNISTLTYIASLQRLHKYLEVLFSDGHLKKSI